MRRGGPHTFRQKGADDNEFGGELTIDFREQKGGMGAMLADGLGGFVEQRHNSLCGEAGKSLSMPL
jgi:hypothetical protein